MVVQESRYCPKCQEWVRTQRSRGRWAGSWVYSYCRTCGTQVGKEFRQPKGVKV